MPSLPRTEVEQIALLARLYLDEAELVRMQAELGAILEHFTALAAIDTDGVPPLTHAVPQDLRLRADEAAPSLPAEQALRGAPARDGDLFVVPSIIPGGTES
jgi:aspartyl-tRNA(Asn)/glutamyl-tRNA(Gln) amidotransferase subunit C